MDKSTSNKAVFADGTRFKGHIKNARAIEINGTVEADLKADKVTIGSDGKFVGSITADLIVVSGHYDGNMDAGSIWATATAQITGKIQYKTLQMDRGAALNCRVVHNWKPEKAKAKKTTSKDAAVVEADQDVNPKTTDGSVANVVADDGDDTSQFAPGSDSTNKKGVILDRLLIRQSNRERKNINQRADDGLAFSGLGRSLPNSQIHRFSRVDGGFKSTV